MPDTDPAQAAAEALRAAGVEVHPVGEEMDEWAIGCFVFTDAELVRLAVSRGLLSEDE
jgi:hypothetical protein